LEISAGTSGLSGKRSQQASESVEVEVKPTAADRYYELLPKLIAGRSKNPKRPWLHEVSAQSGPTYNLARQAAGLCRVHEGDFVRIENAHLFLPPMRPSFRRSATRRRRCVSSRARHRFAQERRVHK
jgi:hypothetical protein